MLKLLGIFLTFSLSVVMSANAQTEIGFTRGAVFSAIPVQGKVKVECSGFNGTGSATYNCRDVVLEPSAYDYFKGPIDTSVDRIELTAYHQDGSSRVRSMGYIGSEGRSAEAVNLWISTIFQKPLLEKGKNRIQYRTFSAKSAFQVLAEGEFTVEVQKSAGRTCQNAEFDSTDTNDCHSQYSICQRYFEELKNCK